jgi:chromosome segregation ATPase
MVPFLLIALVGISLLTGWWIGSRARTAVLPPTGARPPADEGQSSPPAVFGRMLADATDPATGPSTTTGGFASPNSTGDTGRVALEKQLDAARIAAANSRHGLEEAKAELARVQADLERTRALATDREAKLRLAERMITTANDARRAAADAQLEAEEQLAQLRLEHLTGDARAHEEAGTWRERAAALERDLHEARRLQEPLHIAIADRDAHIAALEAAVAQSDPPLTDDALAELVADLTLERDELHEALESAGIDYDALRKAAQSEIDLLRGDLAAATDELEELRSRVFASTRRRVS